MSRSQAESLARWIEANRPRLLMFVRRRLGAALARKIEPDDVLQEVGVEAVRLAGDAASQTDDERFAWLCHLAERRIIDAHRRFFGAQKRDAAREASLERGMSQSRNVALVDLLVASVTTPSQAFSRDAREARLLDGLAQLPVEQREALRLRYLEGRPSKEIAQLLGKSDGAVRVMLTRALRQLGDLVDA